MTRKPLPTLLTAKEAAELLGVRTSTLYAYASRGLLGAAARGPGRSARYPRELVETLKKKAQARAGHTAVAAAALRWGEPVLDSRITRLSPRGPEYRGKRATELVAVPMEEVVSLLWDRPVDWTRRVPGIRSTAPRPSLRALLELVVAASADSGRTAAQGRSAVDWAHASALLGRLVCIAGVHEAAAEQESTLAGALTVSLLGPIRGTAGRRARRCVNAAMVLLADHELNASTFAARVAASARAPWLDCVVSALGAAAGVRHVSACDSAESLWQRARGRGSVHDFVRDEWNAGTLAGFDAGAYPQGDPRAQCLLDVLAEGQSSSRRRSIESFLSAVDEVTGQLPAIDFALAVMADELGMPPGASTVVFAVARFAGWVAHIDEQWASQDFIRPRAAWKP